MSTEVMSPAAKDKSAKTSKKRRREEELAQSKDTTTEADVTPSKKPKTDTTSAKKDKKKKKSKQAEDDAAEDAKPAASVATAAQAEHAPANTETKKSKKKKQKDSQVEAAEANGAKASKPSAPSFMKKAVEKVKQPRSESPFVQQTTSFYLALSPIAHHFPLEGLCAEHISPLILTYYPPMKGVVLSYDDPRMSESPEKGVHIKKAKQPKTVLGQSVDEYAVTYIWLTVDLLIFKPQRDTVLEGYVNLQNESILGLICYNYFNAGIERSRLPKDWQWVEDEAPEVDGEMSRKGRRDAAGHYVDGEGNKVEGKISFKVKDFEATAGAESGSGSINIYGTLLSESDDAKADEEVRQKNLVRERPARR